jgi:hypothetical protein
MTDGTARSARRGRRSAAVLAALALGVLAAPAAAPAAATVGFSEQQPAMFYDPLFQELGVRHARLIVPWNTARDVRARREVDAWMFAARLANVVPLVSFNHSRRCFARTCKLPGAAQYTRAFRAFRARYPWVREYSPWNEANHFSQPTYRKPRAAATYYNIARRACNGCKIVAADVLDQGDAAWYLHNFLRFAKGRPRIWGLHNYSDTNRFRSRGTARILRTVKGVIWLTETGGVVKFGRAFPFSPSRAARATSYMFRLAKLNRRISRLYIYQWTGAPRNARFDAGIISPNGKPRPAYYVVRKRIGRRRPTTPPATTTPTDPGAGVIPAGGAGQGGANPSS